MIAAAVRYESEEMEMYEFACPACWAVRTVTLTPGRYELLCNIAGHYGAGMYTELDVVTNR